MKKGIAKWRVINPQQVEQKIKSLPLGSEDAPEVNAVIGHGDNETNWMRRVSAATQQKKNSDDRWNEIATERQEEQARLDEIAKNIEERRKKGNVWG